MVLVILEWSKNVPWILSRMGEINLTLLSLAQQRFTSLHAHCAFFRSPCEALDYWTYLGWLACCFLDGSYALESIMKSLIVAFRLYSILLQRWEAPSCASRLYWAFSLSSRQESASAFGCRPCIDRLMCAGSRFSLQYSKLATWLPRSTSLALVFSPVRFSQAETRSSCDWFYPCGEAGRMESLFWL